MFFVKKKKLEIKYAHGVILFLMLFVKSTSAEVYFHPDLITNDISNVADLNTLNYEGAQLPGKYKVSVFLNGEFLHEKFVDFIKIKEAQGDAVTLSDENDVRDTTGLIACINYADIKALNVDLTLLSLSDDIINAKCLSPGFLISGAYTKFDFQKMKLDISIPQDALLHVARGYIPAESMDNGINSLIMNYQFSNNRVFTDDSVRNNSYLNLYSGINLGGWRFRDITNYNKYDGKNKSYSKWNHLKTWAERSVIPIKSNLQIGNLTSNSDVFDNINFYGVQIYTDESMHPESLRGFAPTIRGVARTNANVTIRQNGSDIYQTMVSPGSFTISDLYPVYSSGDLEVMIAEADGGKQFFVVPYSSIPLLQREGQGKYSLALGKVRYSNPDNDNDTFIQASFLRGFSHGVTAYSGLQIAEKYKSVLGGVGLNLGPVGAISGDFTQATSRFSDGNEDKGHSLRLRYARSLNSTGTTIQLAGYRYSSKGYYSFDEAASGNSNRGYCTPTSDEDRDEPFITACDSLTTSDRKKKGKMQLSLSQTLGEAGSFFITGTKETYHFARESANSLQMGINSHIGSANYGVYFNYASDTRYAKANKSIYFNVSLPLSALLPFSKVSDDVRASYMVNTSKGGSSTHQVSLSGTALEEKNLNWDVTHLISEHASNSGSLNGNYQGKYGTVSSGYGYGQAYKQVSYGLSGGIIVHSEGVTFGQQIGDTAVLIAAPGINDVAVENETGVSTDWRGYAIKPFASPYRENRIALDVSDIDYSTVIDNPVVTVVPTRGAVVKAKFAGRQGKVFIMTITHKGKVLPFGSMVLAEDNNGIVNESGSVYLSGMPAEGEGKVQWGNAPSEQCAFSWDSSKGKSSTKNIHRINVECN